MKYNKSSRFVVISTKPNTFTGAKEKCTSNGKKLLMTNEGRAPPKFPSCDELKALGFAQSHKQAFRDSGDDLVMPRFDPHYDSHRIHVWYILPTLCEKWPHSRGNVSKYTIYDMGWFTAKLARNFHRDPSGQGKT